MSNAKVDINSLASELYLCQVDMQEVQALRDNLRFFANAMHNKISLHDAAHQMITRVEHSLVKKGQPRSHTTHIDALEARVRQIQDSLDYFISLYACDCAEQDRQDRQQQEYNHE